MTDAPRVFVIAGSVRPRRICHQISTWVAALASESGTANFEVVDLKEWTLPLDDEPGIPAKDAYVSPHTKAWSEKIAGAQAFIFVTPQYNWGYPAALKNALDHLYREWNGKPAAIVSYGGHGGAKCAAQLRQVLEGLKMKPVATMPELTLTRERITADSGVIEAVEELSAHLPELRRMLEELGAALPG